LVSLHNPIVAAERASHSESAKTHHDAKDPANAAESDECVQRWLEEEFHDRTTGKGSPEDCDSEKDRS
jgi:hypothetical protein